MKKINFLKTLLVAIGLAMGVNGAWADGNKRVLESQNYEAAIATDWTSPNGVAKLTTGDAVYGNYAQCDVSGNGNRSNYKSVSDYTADGYADAAMTAAGYVIEWDLRMAGGRQKDRSNAQFIVTTDGPNLATNSYYTGTDYIFAISQPTNTTGGLEKTWYINDLDNTQNAITLENDWYHYQLVVTESSVNYTITKVGDATPAATGSLTVASLPIIKGFFGLTGRTYGSFAFDNFEIYDYVDIKIANAPTIALKSVSGADRIYTIANPNGEGTLYYTTAPAEEAPAVGDAAYTSTTDAVKTVTISEAGNYYAYVVLDDGTTTSDITAENDVTVGEIVLPTPTYIISNMEEGYGKTFTVTTTNNVLLEPTVKLSYVFTSAGGTAYDAVEMTDNIINATVAGTYVVTASAEGYTSSQLTIDNSVPYKVTKTIDFSELTEADFGDLWKNSEAGLRDYWHTRMFIPQSVVIKELVDKTAETAATAVKDITVSNAGVHDPQIVIGYGLYTPYYTGVSGNNMNFTINDATAEQLAVYEGWNNYGGGTFKTVQAADAVFGLYRYDTILRSIKIYSVDNEAPMYLTYTVKTNFGKVIKTGTAEKNESFTVDVAEVIEDNGTYYVLDHETTPTYYQNYEMGDQDLEYTINYTEDPTIVYYNDGEETSYMYLRDWAGSGYSSGNYCDANTGANHGNARNRGFQLGNYAAGSYEITVRILGQNRQIAVRINNGDYNTGNQPLASVSGSGNYLQTATFVLGGEKPIVLTGGNNGDAFGAKSGHMEGFDYIIIRKTDDKPLARVTVPATGYTTFFSEYALDFTETGLTAYIATVENGAVVFKSAKTVPANTGVLVKGDAKTYDIPVIASSETNVEANEFVGSLINLKGETGIFMLMAPEGQPMGFYKTTDETVVINAATAYLPASVAPDKTFISIDGTTGISGAVTEKGQVMNDKSVYNLNGQRVEKALKGLYIQNGKKIVKK